MILDNLEKRRLITPPPFVVSNCVYLTICGSHSYGVADTAVKASKMPDMDIYGLCIPPKDHLFVHLRGEIPGFGTPGPRFEQWSQHHIIDVDAHGGHGQEYDFTIFNIVKYFELCRTGNPNMIDTLFTPETCVLHCTKIGRMIRDARKMFISKEIWAKFRGYAASQLHKIRTKSGEGSRKEIIERFGYDVKFGYHVLRLFDEAQQLLETGEMNLQRAKESMKAIRRGDWSMEQLIDWAAAKEKELELAFTNCSLPPKPDEAKLKTLLLQCLEEHYGTLSAVFQQPDWAMGTLKDIDELLNTVRSKLYA